MKDKEKSKVVDWDGREEICDEGTCGCNFYVT